MTGLRAELRPFRLALKAPLVTGGVSIRFRAGFLVALGADGITGWGEASPLPGWSRNSLLETEAALRDALDAINAAGEAALHALVAGLGDAPHARAGVTGAWADLQARRSDRSLAEHLAADAVRADAVRAHAGRAGAVRADAAWADAAGADAARAGPAPVPGTSVAVNALIAAPAPAAVEQAAHDAAAAGFTAVKLKVGASDPAVDVDRIRVARAGLGPTAELRLDANGAWDEPTALDVLRRVQDCDIAYCEEPVAGIEAVAALGRRSPVPVAVDESIRSEADAARALDLGVGTLVVKPQALGGHDVALSIAARAHEAGACVVVTSFLDSAVGVTHALHVAAALDAAALASADAAVAGAAAPPRRAHGLATAGLLAADVSEAPPVASGAMAVPAGAGLGLAPELAASSAAPP